MDVAPTDGWLTGSELGEIYEVKPVIWKEPLLAAVLFFLVIFFVTLQLLLVNKRRHQMLLQVRADSKARKAFLLSKGFNVWRVCGLSKVFV